MHLGERINQSHVLTRVIQVTFIAKLNVQVEARGLLALQQVQ